MKALLKAELFKLCRQGKTWYALLAVFIIEVIILITAYYQGAAILEVLLESLQRTFYFEGNLLNGNLILYIVLNSLWFNLPLILMIVTSSIVTDEYKDGTLKTLLLQSVSKWKLILAKYITAIIFTLFVIAFMALSTSIMAYTAFGKGDLIVYLNSLNFFSNEDAFWRIAMAFGSGAVSMMFYAVISVTLAIFIKEPAKTWIISALFLILTNLLLKADFGNDLLNATLFPKLIDTWQYFFYYEISYRDIIINTGLLLLYTILFIVLGTARFHKKDLE